MSDERNKNAHERAWEYGATNRWLQALPEADRVRMFNTAEALAALTGTNTSGALDMLCRIASKPAQCQGAELAKILRDGVVR